MFSIKAFVLGQILVQLGGRWLQTAHVISVTSLLNAGPQICQQEWVRIRKETMFSDTLQYILTEKILPWHGFLSSLKSYKPVFINKQYQGNFGIWTHANGLQNLIRPHSDSEDRKSHTWASCHRQGTQSWDGNPMDMTSIVRRPCITGPLSFLNDKIPLTYCPKHALCFFDFLSFFLIQFLKICIWGKIQRGKT